MATTPPHDLLPCGHSATHADRYGRVFCADCVPLLKPGRRNERPMVPAPHTNETPTDRTAGDSSTDDQAVPADEGPDYRRGHANGYALGLFAGWDDAKRLYYRPERKPEPDRDVVGRTASRRVFTAWAYLRAYIFGTSLGVSVGYLIWH
jgi:hypothetical protein